jgi:hypothetical protein
MNTINTISIIIYIHDDNDYRQLSSSLSAAAAASYLQ